MKKFKKIMALVMAMAMVLGMSVTTFAASNPNNPDGVVGNDDDRGDIVVSGIEEKNAAVKAYMIAPAQYDEVKGNFTGYSNPHNITLTAPKKDEIETIDISGLTAIDLSYDAASKTYKAVNQRVGMYLIVVPSNNSTTYNRAVASIYYSNDDGETNVLNSADLTMTTKLTQSATWIKKDVDVDVTKTVKTGTQTPAAGNTAKIGDTLTYEVKIDHAPRYNGPNPKLFVTDVLSEGLTYTPNSLKVYAVDDSGTKTLLIENTHYISNNASVADTLTVNFVRTDESTKAKTYLLTETEVGKAIVIEYTATLNEQAALNGKDNGNTVTLDYTRDSSVADGVDEDHPTDKTHTYTFDIDGQTTGSVTETIINKVGAETTKENPKGLLDGATFTLYQNKTGLAINETITTEEALREAITAIDDNKYETTSFDGTTTTDAKGQVKITGLPAGTYYLKETEAPGGYSLNTHVFKIEIVATIGEDGTLVADSDGSEWSIKIDDTTTAKFDVNHESQVVTRADNGPGIDIQNTKLSELPSTGGIGTTIFTIGGCAIMILAAGLYFASRRKAAK